MTPPLRPLKLYADRNYFPPGGEQVPLLLPFWGEQLSNYSNIELDDHHELETLGAELFELASLAECDLALYPAYWREGDANEQAHRLAAQAKAAGKQALIFFWSDLDEPIPVDNAIVYRTSLTRSRRRPNERVPPALVKDWGLEMHAGSLRLREFSSRPVVGFCGYVAKRKNAFHNLIHAAAGFAAAGSRLGPGGHPAD